MKRKLRPSIQKTLELTLFILVGLIASISDFEFKAIPLFIAIILSITAIGCILNKYGKYEEE